MRRPEGQVEHFLFSGVHGSWNQNCAIRESQKSKLVWNGLSRRTGIAFILLIPIVPTAVFWGAPRPAPSSIMSRALAGRCPPARQRQRQQPRKTSNQIGLVVLFLRKLAGLLRLAAGHQLQLASGRDRCRSWPLAGVCTCPATANKYSIVPAQCQNEMKQILDLQCSKSYQNLTRQLFERDRYTYIPKKNGV